MGNGLAFIPSVRFLFFLCINDSSADNTSRHTVQHWCISQLTCGVPFSRHGFFVLALLDMLRLGMQKLDYNN